MAALRLLPIIWLAAASWYGFILVMTWSPKPPVPVPETSDWLLHGIAFAVQGALLAVACGLTWPSKSPWLAIAIGAVLGAIDEAGQTVVPGRSAALSDLAADTVGTALGVGALWWAIGYAYRRYSHQQHRTRPGGTENGRDQKRGTSGL